MWVWMNGTFGISYEPLTGAIINGVNANHIGPRPYVRVYSPYGASIALRGIYDSVEGAYYCEKPVMGVGRSEKV